MEQDKNSIGNIVAISLILLLVGILIFLLLRASDSDQVEEQTKETFENKELKEDSLKENTFFKKEATQSVSQSNEKTAISRSLDSLIVKYNQAMEMNTEMSDELAEEKKRILILRDSINALKSYDYSSFEDFKEKITEFEEKNSELLAQNNSLVRQKNSLSSKLRNANSKLEDANEEIDTLRTQVRDLTVKVSQAAKIRIFNGNIYSMRRKRNGQFLETNKARRTNAFRVNFSLEANNLADDGERRIYLQISDEDGRVLSQIGSFALENGKEIPFSDYIDANYSNKNPRELVSLVEVNRLDLKRGSYFANVFIDNYYAGRIEVILR